MKVQSLVNRTTTSRADLTVSSHEYFTYRLVTSPPLRPTHCLSCSGCPILAVPPCHLFWKSFLAALSWQSCSGNPILAVLSWQSYFACPLLPVNFCLTRSVCPVLAILFLLLAVVTNRNFRKKVTVQNFFFF